MERSGATLVATTMDGPTRGEPKIDTVCTVEEVGVIGLPLSPQQWMDQRGKHGIQNWYEVVEWSGRQDGE